MLEDTKAKYQVMEHENVPCCHTENVYIDGVSWAPIHHVQDVDKMVLRKNKILMPISKILYKNLKPHDHYVEQWWETEFKILKKLWNKWRMGMDIRSTTEAVLIACKRKSEIL